MESQNNHLFHKEVLNIYSTISEAKSEIRRRRNDVNLVERINAMIGLFPIDGMQDKAYSCLSRPVITPNYELKTFLSHSEILDLPRLFLEYPGRMVSRNDEKYHAMIMYYFNGTGRNHGHKVSKIKIADISKFEGKPLNDVKTLWNEPLLDFHHDLLYRAHPEIDPKSILDFTSWFNGARSCPVELYYYKYLLLFICNGILFDNFLFGHGEENPFIESKFLPSFKKVLSDTGLKPLIVPLLPLSNERLGHWLYYPENLKDFVKGKIPV